MSVVLDRQVIEFIMYFYIYAFLGWVLEVAFHALKCGKFINRGMLAGAVCPIYGFGAVTIIHLLDPIKNNLLFLFIGSGILCTVLEYLVGLGLDKLFHKRWWDYSDVPFNIGGYVCLQFSAYWGIGGIILVRDIQDLIGKLVNMFSTEMLLVFSVIFTIMILIDTIATVSSIHKFNKRLELLSEIQFQIHNLSNMIGEGVTERTLEIADKSQPAIENFEHKREKLKEEGLKVRNEMIQGITRKIAIKEVKIENKKADKINRIYESLNGGKNFIDRSKSYTLSELQEKKNRLRDGMAMNERRLIKAFPSMKENKRTCELNEIKNNIVDKKL